MSATVSKPLQPREIQKVSVILPTYNEAGNIVDLCIAIHQAVTHPHEIIVVDDNSPDGTSRLIQELIDSGGCPGLRLETRMTDRGLTKSIQRGIDLAQGDTVVWMDCDFSMPPAAIPELLAKIEAGYDIAVASRFLAGGKFKDAKQWFGGEESKAVILLSRFLNWFLRHALFAPRLRSGQAVFTDFTSGFIAIRREVLQKIRLHGDYGEYFIDLIFRLILLGFSFTEIPYENVPRRAGESKTGSSIMGVFKRGWPYLWTILRMWTLRLRQVFTD